MGAGGGVALGLGLGLLGVFASRAGAEIEIHGFVEAAAGVRTAEVTGVPDTWRLPSGVSPPAVWSGDADFTLRESRLQLRGDGYGERGEAHFRVDFLRDEVAEQDGVAVDLREGYLKFNVLSDRLEVRAGRQPTTWGTGDLLFVNDLFPKDWVSFFAGREDQYLKAPSDAFRFGIFGLPFESDIVYTPRFSPDLTPTGERFVFWAPQPFPVHTPGNDLENGELAIRLNRYVGGWNVALYGYRGFWKSPLGVSYQTFAADSSGSGGGFAATYVHPRLNVYGASVRGGTAGGIGWLEMGYYDSRDAKDLCPDGCAPAGVVAPRSELRGMAGYERQWFTDFTAGLQVYGERMQDRDAALADLRRLFGENAYLKDEFRWLLTLRLDQLLFYQTLRLSSFTYYSPSDEDAYLRLSASYKPSDDLELTIGGNVFEGNDRRTQFGMGNDNDNVYTRFRYSF